MRSLAILFVCMLFVPLRVLGLDSLSTQSIEGFVVVGDNINREVVSVQSLSGDRLESLSAHSVADAVRYFSGAQIKDYGGVGGLKTVDIRSMGSHHVGVFYDGVELGNAQNGVVDLGRFSLDNMESVAMYNGQKSSIFQSAKDYASASAIYMTTRRPQFDHEDRCNLNIGVKGGSFETINPSVLWEQRLSERLRSSVSVEYLYTSGEYQFSYSKADGYDTTAIRQNGDVRYLRSEAALFGDMEGGDWQVKIYNYSSERGYPGAVIREEPGVFKNEDRQWDNNLFVQGSAQQTINSWYRLKASAKYANDYLHYLSDPDLDVSTMYIDNTYRQEELYGSLSHLFGVSHWMSLSVANDFQYNLLDANLVSFVYPRRYTSLNSAAASFSYRRLRAQTSLLYTHVHDVTQQTDASAEDLSRFTPTAVVSYSPFEQSDLAVRALYKRIFRMPTLNDLYYTFIGNIDLDPEYTTQYSLGATYRIAPNRGVVRSVELQLDGYFNQVENKIIAMPTSNQFRWTMINLGYVEIRGVESVVDVGWQFGAVGVSTRLSYTYQQAQDLTDPTSEYYGGQIPYIPWHSGSLIVGCDWRGWLLNYSFIYTGERYESVANTPENYALPWYTSDVSLTRAVRVVGVDCRVTAELNNLLDQQYEVVQCYPMPGRNYKLKLNIML